MRSVLPSLLAVVVALASAVIDAQSNSAAAATLRGVWRVAEVVTTGPNASTYTKPQPGLYIFTARHYSFVRVTADKPRPNQPPVIAKATAAELIAVWDLFQGQSGTYEVAGGDLTVRPLAAKNPTVMASGSFTIYSYKLEGNALTLTNKSNNGGPIANPTTLRLTRVE